MQHDPKPRRAATLHAVIDEIVVRKDGQIPYDVEGVEACFDGIEDLANALLLRWHTRLVASLERGLADEPLDREEVVIDAWRHANEIYRGVRMVIDELEANPNSESVAHAIRMTARNDWATMAIAAGLASRADEAAVRAGHRLELQARRRDLIEENEGREQPPQTMLKKLREKLTG